MTTFVGLLAAMVTIAAAGFGVTMLLARQRLTTSEYLALAWLFGTAVVSLSLWIGGLVIRGIALQLVMTAFCVLLGAVGFARWRKLSSKQKSDSWKIADIIFVALFAIELMSIFWLSFQHTLGWDGLTVWELKARYAFLNGGVLPAAYFTDGSRWFSHPEYPLLLPLTETWFYLWIGDCDQFWIKLIFPIWYAAAMSILLLAAEELSGKRWIAWTIVLLFPLVPAIYSAPGGVLVGYADLPLAAIYLAAILYLLRFLRNESRDALALFITLGAALPWMKREGAILWAVLAVCGAIIIWRRRSLTMSILSVLPGIAVIASWKIFLIAVHALPSRDFVSLGRGSIDRTGRILHELYLQLIDWRLWDIFWLLVAIALIAALIRQRSARVAVLVWLLLAPLVCYCTSYVFSAWPDYIAHIETSLPRLLIQLTPVGWLLIALALRSTSTQPAPLEPQPAAQSALGTDCN
jgi:hypothetical protein